MIFPITLNILWCKKKKGVQMAEKPLDIIHKSIDGVVLIELKGGREFRGTLKGYDIHMNLVLKDAEELVNGEIVRNFGYVVIRGDSVVLISPSIR